MNPITIFNNANKEIEKLNGLEKEHDKVCDKKINDIYWKYYDLKRELDKKESAEKEVVEKEKEAYKNKIDSEKEPHIDITRDFKHTCKLFGVLLSERRLEFKDNFDRDEMNIIDMVADDEYKKIWVYAARSHKPKNKWSLVIRMKSVFGWKFNDEFGDTDRNLKDLPTEEELKVWYEKNKNNLRWKWGNTTKYLSDYLERHTCLEKDYEKAKELWKSKVWQRAFWLHEKDYYKNNVSRGTDTDEYRDICLLLDTSKINLPLLVGQMKSDEGKKEFERRLKEKGSW